MHVTIGPQRAFGFFSILSVLFIGCSQNEPIKIGFVGSLTQYSTELSIQGRNGAILAVEEINANGGIEGRPIELTIRDVGGSADSCEHHIKELISLGHNFIIGPYTSNMAVAAQNALQSKNAILLTPTMTTDVLEGLDDGILRLQPSNFWQAEQVARHMRSIGLDSAITVYDASNREYAQTLVNSFTKSFIAFGGHVQFVDSIVPKTRSAYDVASALAPIKTQAIFIVTTGAQLASFAQTLRLGKNQAPLFSGSWGMTPETIAQGGASVEGITYSALIPPSGSVPAKFNFEENYFQRFSTVPNFSATATWEAVMSLAVGLRQEESLDPAKVKALLLNQEKLEGVYDTFHWNRFGDAMRTQTLVRIENGKYVALKEK